MVVVVVVVVAFVLYVLLPGLLRSRENGDASHARDAPDGRAKENHGAANAT